MGINVSTYQDDAGAYRDPYLSLVAVSELVVEGETTQIAHGPLNFGLGSSCNAPGKTF